MNERRWEGLRLARIVLVAAALAAACGQNVNEAQVHATEPAAAETGEISRRVRDAVNVSTSGNSVHVVVRERTECIRTSVDTEWHACGTKRLSNVPVLLTAGGVNVSGNTDDNGEATLDLGPVASARNDPQIAAIEVTHGEKKSTESVSLANAPAYAMWKQNVDAQAVREAAAAKLERDSLTLDKLQADLETISEAFTRLQRAPDPWGEAQIPDLQQIDAARKDTEQLIQVVKADTPLDPQLEARNKTLLPLLAQLGKQFSVIQGHIDRAAAHTKQEQATREAQARRVAIPLGRQLVLSTLRSPSTASFAADVVVAQCPSGIVMTMHEVDAQNVLGAVVRQQFCVEFNAVKRQVPLAIGESGGLEIDTACGWAVPGPNAIDEWCGHQGPEFRGAGDHADNRAWTSF